MSLLKSFAFASAAVLLAATAHAAPQAAPKPKATSAKPAPAAPKAKARSIVGTLDKYDAGTNSLVVNTGKGTETVMLSSSSSVKMGAKTLTAADLSSHTGDRVKVRATDEGGHAMASSVTVVAKTAAKPAAAASTTKPTKKK
jgi:phage baseplate assembly protein gpV